MSEPIVTDADTDAVMAAGIDVIRAYRRLDIHNGHSVRAVTAAEVRWSELMRAWMTTRNITDEGTA
jgi:hypothetical protein